MHTQHDTPLVTLDALHAAHDRVRPHVVRTPLVPFPLEDF